MKLSHVAVGAIVLFLAACGAQKMRMAASSQGPWKLVFQKPTLLTDVVKFEHALDGDASRWEKTMKVKKEKGDQPHQRPDYTHGQAEPVATVFTYPSHNQPPNPDSLHVTQKVVLYNQTDLDAILPLIEYQETSVK